jgi:hypothetical protein
VRIERRSPRADVRYWHLAGSINGITIGCNINDL